MSTVTSPTAQLVGKAGRPVALTMGDPAGIGIEIALKSWLARDSTISAGDWRE